MSEEKKVEEVEELAVTFLGEYLIDNIEDIEGNDKVVRVTLKLPEPVKNEDGSEDVAVVFNIPKWELEAVMTLEESDASTVRHKRSVVVVDKIYDLIKELDVRTEDINHIMQTFIAKLQGVENQAILNLYDVDTKNEIRVSSWEDNL